MIIDVENIIQNLQKKGLNITNNEEFKYYVKNFNVNTFLSDYCDFFVNNEEKFDDGVTSDDIIKLYNFDKNLGVHVFRCLLIIEKIINTSVVYATINVHKIEDKCLLNIDENTIKNSILRNLNEIEPYTEFKPFLFKITKYLESNKSIKKLMIRDEQDNIYKWHNVPLDMMCLTWSFAMTFNFFIASSLQVKQLVMENLEIDKKYYEGFIDLIKNFINIRNHISHNIVLYNSQIKYATDELCDLYFYIFKQNISKNDFKLIHLIRFISVLSNQNRLFERTIYFAKNLQISEPFKSEIEKLFEI